jgi:hypothetical protein
LLYALLKKNATFQLKADNVERMDDDAAGENVVMECCCRSGLQVAKK